MRAKGIKAKTRTTSTRVQAKRTTVKTRSKKILNDSVNSYILGFMIFVFMLVHVDDAGECDEQYESGKSNEKAGGTSATERAEHAKEPTEEQDKQE